MPSVKKEDRDPFNIAVGKRLYQLRMSEGLTQERMAVLLTGSRKRYESYRSWEDGRHPVPLRILRKAAEAFKRPIGWFYGADDSGLSEDELGLVAMFRRVPAGDRTKVKQVLSVYAPPPAE